MKTRMTAMILTTSLIISLLSACGSDSQNTSEIVAVSETVEEIAETQPESVETEVTAETERDENAQETEVGDVEDSDTEDAIKASAQEKLDLLIQKYEDVACDADPKNEFTAVTFCVMEHDDPDMLYTEEQMQLCTKDGQKVKYLDLCYLSVIDAMSEYVNEGKWTEPLEIGKRHATSDEWFDEYEDTGDEPIADGKFYFSGCVRFVRTLYDNYFELGDKEDINYETIDRGHIKGTYRYNIVLGADKDSAEPSDFYAIYNDDGNLINIVYEGSDLESVIKYTDEYWEH